MNRSYSFSLAVAAMVCWSSPTLGQIIGEGPSFQLINSIAMGVEGDLFVTDELLNALMRVDPINGDRTILSDAATGEGPNFFLPIGVAVDPDFGDVFVVDEVLASVIRVDPITGDRTIVSGQEIGEGPSFVVPAAIAVEATGDLVLADNGLTPPASIFRVDPVTGDRTIVSDAAIGAGDVIPFTEGIAVDFNGNFVVTACRCADAEIAGLALVGVDAETGDRTTISDAVTGDGPPFGGNVGIGVEDDGSLVTADFFFQQLVRTDSDSGDRTIISDANIGDGPLFEAPSGITIDRDNGDLLVVDHLLNAVVRVDPNTGDRDIVSRGPTLGFLKAASGLAAEADGGLVTADFGLDAVVRANAVTGELSIVSDFRMGDGPFFDAPFGITVDANGDLLVADNEVAAVFQVDPITGDRTILSGLDTGDGPSFLAPISLAVEDSGDVVVSDSDLAAVVRVDPVTGDRTIVSDANTGDGPPFPFVLGLAAEPTGDIVAVDVFLSAVVRVDPFTGDRTILSGPDDGDGPLFGLPADVEVDHNGTIFVFDRGGLPKIFTVDPITGDRAVLSGPDEGAGPALRQPTSITVLDTGELAVIEHTLGDKVVIIDPVTGDRMILPEIYAEVSLDSGEFRFVGTGAPIGFNFYEIVSDSGSLVPANWLSFAEQGVGSIGVGVGESFNEFSDIPTRLSEVCLLCSATVEEGVEISLGNIFELNVAGDYNKNGVVDAPDYVNWRDSFSDVVEPGTGADGNGNGVIDAADYNVWRDHFGSQGGVQDLVVTIVNADDLSEIQIGVVYTSRDATGVPEPSALLLLISATLGMALTRRDWRSLSCCLICCRKRPSCPGILMRESR